ncbi:uncharacterized protein LY89DRAFT_679115 [Mollisia scopiformis]|uniref:Zn(2)-C6 fungal-type domain-containing protein n=1 Tax=Mollisia scopiformis TaxID=149040 RepID=A0A194XUT5_MOLSC|nr:uncharacterized protein LY89DRAFT_679115 [Mollisia scopiformis]KUJ23799.1 hypothetical protein LY89DRAFT_679115 [Mollisia scopiformis]
MNDPEENVISTHEMATTTTTPSKPLSWSRNHRTSCDSCKQMKIKCQRTDDGSCSRCIARQLPCTTTPVERKRRRVTKY